MSLGALCYTTGPDSISDNACISLDTGLEIHVGANSGMSRFDYGWGAFNESLCPIHKVPLTLYEATFPHIRLHKLTKDDSLELFMFGIARVPLPLGVVLINFDNSYQLPEKFLSNGESPVPVILVTNETGFQLLKFLQENPRDTEVTIHTEDYQPPIQPCKLPIGEYMCNRQLLLGYMYIHVCCVYWVVLLS